MADTATAPEPTTRRQTPAPAPAPASSLAPTTAETAVDAQGLAPAEQSIADLQGTAGNAAVSGLLGADADAGVDGSAQSDAGVPDSADPDADVASESGAPDGGASTAGATTDPATDPAAATDPATAPTTDAAAGPATDAAAGPVTDAAAGPATDAATGPAIDAATGPATDSVPFTGGPEADGAAAGMDAVLVDTELAEHERWGAALQTTGGAQSADRAGFVAEQVGAGLGSGFGQGFAAGFMLTMATRGATRLAARRIPVPIIGSIIGGAIGAYGLATALGTEQGRAELAGKLDAIGEGASGYEQAANTIDGLITLLDLAGNVLDTVGLVCGVIAGVAWLGVVPSFGATSPVAVTCTSIATSVGAASAVIGLVKMGLTPVVTLLRALHTFTSDADPRAVQAQGARIAAASGAMGGVLGGLAGTKVGGAAANRLGMPENPPGAARYEIPDGAAPRTPADSSGPSVEAAPPAAAPDVEGGRTTLPGLGPEPHLEGRPVIGVGDDGGRPTLPGLGPAQGGLDGAPGGPAGEATPWPMAGPAGEDLRLSYPSEGGAFRYEAGPQPETNPFAGLRDDEIDSALAGLDDIARGDSPTPGSVRAGDFQQVDIAPLEPRMPQNRAPTSGYRNPLSPPGAYAYGTPGAPDGGPYHGAMGRSDLEPGVQPDGTTQDAPVYRPAEEFGVSGPKPSYAVRVGPPGSYVDHIFTTREEAMAYAQQVAARGEGQIRDQSALPEAWPGGSPGNPVDAARVFEIPPDTPFLRSGIAPQPESAAGRTGVVYPGGGPQIQLPYGTVGRGSVPIPGGEVPISNRSGSSAPAPTEPTDRVTLPGIGPPAPEPSDRPTLPGIGPPAPDEGRVVQWPRPPEHWTTRDVREGEEWMEWRPGGFRGAPSLGDWDSTNDATSVAAAFASEDQPATGAPYTADNDPYVGLAQDRQGDARTTVERVSPDYERPPGTPEQLAAMRREIADTVRLGRTADVDAANAAADRAETERRAAQIDQLDSGVQTAQQATEAHQQEVSATAAANAAQQERQEEAGGSVTESASRMAGLGTLEVLLSGWVSGASMFGSIFEGIALVVPPAQSAADKCHESAAEATSFMAQLTQARMIVDTQATQGPLQMGRLRTEEGALTAEETRAQESTGQLDTAQTGLGNAREQNSAEQQAAAQNEQRAQTDAADLGARAEQRQSDHDQLAADLQAWAQRHAEQRHTAVAETTGRLVAAGYEIVGSHDY